MKINTDTDVASEGSVKLNRCAKRLVNLANIFIIPLLIGFALLLRWNFLETQQLLLQQTQQLQQVKSRCGVEVASADFPAARSRQKRSTISKQYG